MGLPFGGLIISLYLRQQIAIYYYVVACCNVIAAVGSHICKLACMVPFAIGMGVEGDGDWVYGWGFPAIACLHHAHNGPYAYVLGCWGL